jgi:hypothetical protein
VDVTTQELLQVTFIIQYSYSYSIDIGPVKAYKLIKEVKTIENVIVEI